MGRGGGGQGNTERGRVLVGGGDTAGGPTSEGDRVAEPALPGGVEDGVDLADVRVHLGAEVWAVADGDRSQFPGELRIVRAGGADDRGARGDRELSRDEAD